jgi:hypothetical protein
MALPTLINHYDPPLFNSAVIIEQNPTKVSTPIALDSFTSNISNLSSNKTINHQASVSEPSVTPSPKLPPNRSVNRWTSSEVRILIEQVGKWLQMLQAKDPREKGRVWDKIVSNLQNSDMASSALKERTKASIQQKWDSLLQKYRDIKDRIASTGEEAIQNDWEFFSDMDKYLRKDPSVAAPVTSDSIYGIKHKEDTIENHKEEVKLIYY